VDAFRQRTQGAVSPQPSEAVVRVLVRIRKDTAEFAATQKASELAECKPKCKDLQQAEEIIY